MCSDFHPFLNGLGTCSNKAVTALNLHNTHPAGSGRSKILHPAQGWYYYTIAVQRGKDGFTLFSPDLLVIYLNCKKHAPYLIIIALNLQTS